MREASSETVGERGGDEYGEKNQVAKVDKASEDRRDTPNAEGDGGGYGEQDDGRCFTRNDTKGELAPRTTERARLAAAMTVNVTAQ